ncbi:4418_t:CDS:2 [Entrophospora sp. SA101]|nr:4418_t:CDS:2 [Entrophospora sp. SA101]CAJ0883541.1 13065_t:CDS:2 [Entrophospora sp. SA101]
MYIESDVKIKNKKTKNVSDDDLVRPKKSFNKEQNYEKTTKNFYEKEKEINFKKTTPPHDQAQRLDLELSHIKQKESKVKSQTVGLNDISFENIGLRSEVYDALIQGPLKNISQNSLKPTEIQALSIPQILKSEGQHILIAAETGSGKTLSYLLPVISKLKEQEAKAQPLESLLKLVENKYNNDFMGNINENNLTENPAITNKGSEYILTDLDNAKEDNETINKQKINDDENLVDESSESSNNIKNASERNVEEKDEYSVDLDYVGEQLDHNKSSKDSFFQQELEKEKQTLLLKKSSIRKFNSPRALVLLPSRELVEQVQSVAKILSHFARFRVISFTSKNERRLIRRSLALPIDMIISTPSSILKYTEDGLLSLSELKYMVVDEADTMFSKGFGEEVRNIIQKIKKIVEKQNEKLEKQQSTYNHYNKSINELLDEELPSIKRLTSHSLHKVLPNLQHEFIDMKTYNFNKSQAILEVVSSRALEAFLKSKGFPVIGLYGDIDDRTTKLEAFKNQSLDAKVLVCTDIASRGLDTTFVDHVILYDFPTNMIDFLHRIGRTARIGKRGKATYFITSSNRILAERIKRNIRDNRVLS